MLIHYKEQCLQYETINSPSYEMQNMSTNINCIDNTSQKNNLKYYHTNNNYVSSI